MHDCKTISTGFILDRKNYWLGILFWFGLDWFGLTAFLNEHFRALAHLVRDLPSKFVDVCICIFVYVCPQSKSAGYAWCVCSFKVTMAQKQNYR